MRPEIAHHVEQSAAVLAVLLTERLEQKLNRPLPTPTERMNAARALLWAEIDLLDEDVQDVVTHEEPLDTALSVLTTDDQEFSRYFRDKDFFDRYISFTRSPEFPQATFAWTKPMIIGVTQRYPALAKNEISTAL